jgi:nitrite reductase/ring-hydroxylating ferredoxin subunit
MPRRFPFTSYPKGWFQVAYSDELPRGAVQPLRYFGQDLVLFRTEDGAAHLMNAHCPHLGAHLGYGGAVDGLAIRCPFHGWKFSPEGRCVEAPGAKKIPPAARLEAWLLHEVNGMLLAHHGGGRTAPAWRIPQLPEHGSAEWTSLQKRRWQIRTHVQEIAENIVDPGHFRWVHRTLSMPQLRFKPEGHVFRSFSSVKQPTPRGAVDGHIDAEGFGLGYWAIRFTGIVDLLLISAATPIDEEKVDLRLSFTVRGEGNVGNALIEEISRQVDEDVPIWEHKIYRTRPALGSGDGSVSALRQWGRQFLAA